MKCRRGLAMRILSIVLTIGAKIIGGGRPLLPKILSQSDCIGAKFEQ